MMFALLLVGCAGLVATAAPAAATGNGQISIEPTSPPGTAPTNGRPYFSPQLIAGTQQRDSVTVVNETDDPVTLNLYAADAFTTPEGGFGLQPDYKPKLHMGAWVHLPVSQLTVPPHSGDIVPFTYDPPPNTPPGDYAGGIVAEETQGTTAQHGSVTVEEIKAVGTRVYGRIAGPLQPRLRVTRTSLSRSSPFLSELGGGVDARVIYSVTNTGNQNLTPQATISVSPLFGGGPKSRTVQLPQVLPGSTITFTETFKDVVPLGDLHAKVTVRAVGTTATGTNDAIVIPWGLVAILILLIVGLWLLYRLRGRRRPPERAAPAGDEPAPASEAAAAAPVS